MSADAGPAPRRHDRVWLGRAFEDALRAPLPAGARPAVAAWIAARRPLVATRRDPADPGAIALGLQLAGPRRRVRLLVDPAAVVRVAPPLALAEALGAAPAAWRARLAALDAAARRAGLVLRVHGSLAWQHLSGVAHVTDASDVDLLVRPRDGASLARALALLSEAAAGGAPRLDGEVLLGEERAVAWRELASGAGRLLVRSSAEVALLPRAVALAPLAEVAP